MLRLRIYMHVRAGDYSPQFGLAIGFLRLAVATLVAEVGSGTSSTAGTRRPRHRLRYRLAPIDIVDPNDPVRPSWFAAVAHKP